MMPPAGWHCAPARPRDIKRGQNNDALFTNSALAVAPRTGELKRHYQHMKNDQYDRDRVFARVLGTVKVDGEDRRVVLTGGKGGLFDALDARTGRYPTALDMDLQNFITVIDAVTGDKSADPALVPGRDKGPVFACPPCGRRAQLDAHPVQSANARPVRHCARPLHGADPLANGLSYQRGRHALFTPAGGLLFTGGMDRQILAFDQADGSALWRSAVPGVPKGSRITYAVKGKQYLAIVTGAGNPLAFGLPARRHARDPAPASQTIRRSTSSPSQADCAGPTAPG